MRVAKLELRMMLAIRVPRKILRKLGAATFAAVALTVSLTGDRSMQPSAWKAINVAMGSVQHVSLSDGRTLYVNTNSAALVNEAPSETRIVLDHGEVLIEGKGSKPISVAASGSIFRSGNAAFSVRTRSPLVADVLVKDGAVGMSRPSGRFSAWLDALFPFLAQTSSLSAGQFASVGDQGILTTKALSPEVLAHRLAWKDAWLWFSDESLAEALEQFNSYNDEKLFLADSRLDGIAIGGRFRPTEPDSFVASLKVIFGVRAEARPGATGNSKSVYLHARCVPPERLCYTPLGQ